MPNILWDYIAFFLHSDFYPDFFPKQQFHDYDD